MFKALRAKYGEEIHLLHDSHHRLTPIEAAGWVRNWSRIIFSGLRIP